jgi:hypothetical protein
MCTIFLIQAELPVKNHIFAAVPGLFRLPCYLLKFDDIDYINKLKSSLSPYFILSIKTF